MLIDIKPELFEEIMGEVMKETRAGLQEDLVDVVSGKRNHNLFSMDPKEDAARIAQYVTAFDMVIEWYTGK